MLFDVVKQVMDANGWPSPTTQVATSQDQNMRQSFALANAVLESTSFKKNWPTLVRDYTFDTVAGQKEYPLPADFHHLCAPSAYNATQYFALKGSLTPSQWYRSMYAGAGDGWFDSFRIDPFTSKFVLYPVPTAVEKLAFMYVTKNIVAAADGTPKTKYTADDDNALIDEFLIKVGLSWRWRQKKGMDFTAELAEYNSAVRERFAQFLGTGAIPVGGKIMDVPLSDPRVQWPIGL